MISWSQLFHILILNFTHSNKSLLKPNKNNLTMCKYTFWIILDTEYFIISENNNNYTK